MTRVPFGPPSRRSTVIEQEHTVERFRRFLPAEGSRKDDLVQFIARHGGMRTVAAADLVIIR